MDIITHALLGAAIAPRQELALPMAITSTIPDWWTVPPIVEYLWQHRGRFNNQDFWRWVPARYTELTRWSHSLVVLATACAVGYGIFRTSPWIFLPWLLHLIIDIPTHASSRTGYLFYPWSCWQPLGAVNWYEVWWFSIVTILSLGTVVFFRFLHQ